MTRPEALLLAVLDRLEDLRTFAPLLGAPALLVLLHLLPTPAGSTPGSDDELYGEVIPDDDAKPGPDPDGWQEGQPKLYGRVIWPEPEGAA